MEAACLFLSLAQTRTLGLFISLDTQENWNQLRFWRPFQGGSGLLPADGQGTEDNYPKAPEDFTGIYSPLYEGVSFSRSVFTPTFLPTPSPGMPSAQRYQPFLGIPSLGRVFHADLAVEFNDTAFTQFEQINQLD